MPPPGRCGPWCGGPDLLSGSTATSFAEAQGIDLRIEGPDEVFQPEVPADLLVDMDTPTGPVTLVRPPGTLSVSAPHWATPPVPLGHDEPAWV